MFYVFKIRITAPLSAFTIFVLRNILFVTLQLFGASIAFTQSAAKTTLALARVYRFKSLPILLLFKLFIYHAAFNVVYCHKRLKALHFFIAASGRYHIPIIFLVQSVRMIFSCVFVGS